MKYYRRFGIDVISSKMKSVM